MTKRMTLERKIWLFIVLAMLLATGLRCYQIAADPAGGQLIKSREFQTDEGAYLHNAVHARLFGRALVLDDFNPMTHTPLYTWIQTLNFRWFGVNVVSGRVISAVAGILTALLLFSMLWRFYTPLSACLVFLLLAFTHAWVFYNRVASIETMVVIFMTASFSTWIYALTNLRSWPLDRHTMFWLLLSVGNLAAAVLVKPVGLLLLPIYLAGLAVEIWSRPEQWRRYAAAAIIVLGSLTIFYLIWQQLWIRPLWDYWRDFAQTNIGDRFSLNPARLAKNYLVYLVYCPLFFQMPLIFMAALAAGGRIMTRAFHRKPLTVIEISLALWLFGGVLALGFFAYSPLRFNLLVLPPACALAAMLAAEAFGQNLLFADRHELSWSLLPAGGFAFLQVIHGLFKALAWWGIQWAPAKFYHVPYGGMPAQPGFYLAVFGFVGSLSLVLLAVKTPSQRLRQIAALGLGMTLLASSVEFTRYFQQLDYSMQKAARGIAAIVREQDKRLQPVLAGDVAPTLALENRLFAVHSGFRREQSWRRMLRYQPRFAVASTTIDLEDWAWRFPRFKEFFHPVAQYPVFHGEDQLVLYRIDPQWFPVLEAALAAAPAASP